MNIVTRDREIRRLHGIIDRNSRDVRKYIDSPPHEILVKVSAQFAARAAIELIDLIDEISREAA